MALDLHKRIYSKEVQSSKAGSQVIVAGWAADAKSLGKIAFIKLRDRAGIIQLVSSDKKIIEQASKITNESVIAVEGKVQASKAKAGGNEIEISKIEVLSLSDPKLPIDMSGKIETDLSKRLDWRFLDLRSQKHKLIFEIETEVLAAMREFCLKEGFFEICSPKFQGTAAESGAETFWIDYFGKKATLAQSPQFYKQLGVIAGFEKVFECAPVFRANPSHTTRHDTEFTSFDIEIGFIKSVDDIISLEERWLKYILERVKEKFGRQIKEVFGVEIVAPKIPFPRVTMDEAHKIVKSLGGKVEAGMDLDSEGEKLLSQHILKKFRHEFVFVTPFPWKVRPFYHMRPANNPDVSLSYDLLYNGLEITTGAQREHRYEKLMEQVKDKGLNPKSIQWYLDMFRFGAPPHGGFGSSPTRVVMQMLNLGNVREATFVPRDTERLTP